MKNTFNFKKLLATLLTLVGLFTAISSTTASIILVWEEPKMPDSLINR